MEGIGVVVPVCNAGDAAVAGFVQGHEAAAEAFGRGGDEGEVEAGFFRLLVAALTHAADDFEAQGLGVFAFAVVHAHEGLEGFGQADKADGEGAVLKHFADAVVPVQFVRIDPDAFAHEEGGSCGLFWRTGF